MINIYKMSLSDLEQAILGSLADPNRGLGRSRVRHYGVLAGLGSDISKTLSGYFCNLEFNMI
jgi:hypothetical protein